MAAQRKAVEQVADELYALAPGEFTGARDERAKALRKEGHRDDADAVKALRKPTVAAWALNQLARGRPKELGRLLAAGENLRAAQEELLAGGGRKAFQDAAAKERDEVAKLADEATKLAVEAGERASPALTDKVAATLHAAALDEETAEELRTSRLVREREAIGGFGGVTAAGPAPARRAKEAEPATNDSTEGHTARGRRPAASGAAARGKGGGAARGKGGAAARGKGGTAARGKASGGRSAARGTAREDAKPRAQAEKREAAERRQRLAAARTDERHAQRELDAATKAIEHAETRAEAARVHAEEAHARAKVTADRLKETRREHAAAKKAHTRAQRALEAAERGA
jgi:hypothetical protein